MLTPYDEFPVHQAPYTFSHIPSTDYNWDDGYYFGVFNPDEGVFLATGARPFLSGVGVSGNAGAVHFAFTKDASDRYWRVQRYATGGEWEA